MSNRPSTDDLPFEIGGIKESTDSLELTYKNETGNSVARRQYHRTDGTVHETDEEWMFNFRTGTWERVRHFTREYDLATDQETLVGDGSGWDGAGRSWKGWFKQRHFKHLRLRYPYDSIPEESETGGQQAVVA